MRAGLDKELIAWLTEAVPAAIVADSRAPGRGAQAQSLIAAITMPMTTNTTIAACIHTHVGDTPSTVPRH